MINKTGPKWTLGEGQTIYPGMYIYIYICIYAYNIYIYYNH